MKVKEFSTKVKFLAKYASRVTNLDKGKLEIFLKRLKSDITEYVMIEDNPCRSLSRVQNRALRLEAVKWMIAIERGTLDQPVLVTLSQNGMR